MTTTPIAFGPTNDNGGSASIVPRTMTPPSPTPPPPWPPPRIFSRNRTDDDLPSSSPRIISIRTMTKNPPFPPSSSRCRRQRRPPPSYVSSPTTPCLTFYRTYALHPIGTVCSARA
jgi:hypothetical protein